MKLFRAMHLSLLQGVLGYLVLVFVLSPEAYALDKTSPAISTLAENADTLSHPHNFSSDLGLIELVRKSDVLIQQVEQDHMLPLGFSERVQADLQKIQDDACLSIKERTKFMVRLLENTVNQAVEQFSKPFEKSEDTLQSHPLFHLSRLVDRVSESLAQQSNIRHQVAEKYTRYFVDVFNPGFTEGILQLYKNPDELNPEDIGVFHFSPPEFQRMKGFLMLGVGARLSQMQLLAKDFGIPSAKISPHFLAFLKPLDGKRVRLFLSKEGEFRIFESPAPSPAAEQISSPSRSVSSPLPPVKANKPLGEVIASGVLITRGGPYWESGRGQIRADWGKGPRGLAGKAIEEINLESEIPHRTSYTVSVERQVDPQRRTKPPLAGQPILTGKQIRQLNQLGQKVESLLGDEPHGWDVEWVMDSKGQFLILQARPHG